MEDIEDIIPVILPPDEVLINGFKAKD